MVGNDKQNPNDFGFLVRYYREKKGYSLYYVSIITGISPSYINRLETGQRKNPGLAVIKKLVKALDIPIEKLVGVIELDEEQETDDIETISEVLTYNEYTINGEEARPEVKTALVDIIESILDFCWSGQEKNAEMVEILTLIDKFKKIQ